MEKEKKITLRLLQEIPVHREVNEKIINRDRSIYKTITDYICAAVLAFEGIVQEVELSEKSRRMLINGLITTLHDNGYDGELKNSGSRSGKILFPDGVDQEPGI